MAEQINALQLKIVASANDVIKELGKVEKALDGVKKKVSEKVEPKALEETKRVLTEIGSKYKELTVKAKILHQQGKGATLTEEEKAEKARATAALQYLSTIQKIQKIEDDTAKSAAKAAEAARLKASVPIRKVALNNADQTKLLNYRLGYLDKAQTTALENGDYKRANDIALQMLSVRKKIADEAKKAADADEKSAEALKKQEESAKIASEVGARQQFYENASPLDLLYQKQRNLEAELSAAIEKGDDKKAVSVSEQLLRVKKEILKTEREIANATEGTARATDSVGSGAKTAANAVKEVSKAAKAAEKHTSFLQTLMKSIARIAFYRAIRTAMKNLSQAFKEGTENLYHWSEEYNTNFAPTMDTLKTQMTYLKNGFASMFAPLIEWVVPNVIVPLTDALVELFNLIQQGFAVIVGHDYWYKAQKSMTKFAESTKKANIQLAKFDELNNLTETGSGSDEDASGMFTLEKVATGAGFDFFKELRDAIKDGRWFDFGKIIAESLNRGWDSIDVKAIADKISGVINDAFSALSGFATTLNFEKIGKDIGKFLDRILKKVDWKKMGNATGLMAGGIVKLILNAILEIQPEDVFSAIYDFISGLIIGVSDALFEDNGYLAKKMGLQFAKTVVLAVAYAWDALTHLGDYGIFLSKGESWLMKQLGIDQAGANDFKKATRELAINGLVAPFNTALNELDKNHDKWLAEYKAANAQGANASKTTVQNTASFVTNKLDSTFATIGNHAKTYGDATGRNFDTGVGSGIGGAKSTVTNAINNLTSGVNGTGAGQTWGQQFVNGVSSVISNTGVGSSSGGGTTRFHMIRDARGGFMQFANGGFPSLLSQGTMYVAGEVPGQAEMVGNINGRTGVASGFEITGIRDAVLSTGETEASLLTRLISALERKQLVIAPSAQLGRVMAQSNRMYGAVTG